jgi:hypothetical protein
MSEDVFRVVGAATKHRNSYSESKEDLNTALGSAHADAHILAELECSRLPNSPQSQYIRTKRVGPPSRKTKTLALKVEDEFKCVDKGESGGSGSGSHEQTHK